MSGGSVLSENERKWTEAKIRDLKSILDEKDDKNSQAAEGLRKEIEGLELYLRGW